MYFTWRKTLSHEVRGKILDSELVLDFVVPFHLSLFATFFDKNIQTIVHLLSS